MDRAQMELAPVAPVFDSLIREQLLERRGKLKEVAAIAGTEFEFAGLLDEVDAALRKFEVGRFGECEDCHDEVEAERLLADPLMKVCLGCLTDKQRASLEDDLQLAFDIQQGLLPAVGVRCDKWRVYHAYEPAGIVSGDYVDIIEREDEFYFLLGDVSGKGMAASLLMSNLHAMFHSLVPMNLPLGDLMSRANHMLTESSLANQYATLVCGKANRAGEVEISNAGHLPAIVIKKGVKGELNSAGLPLGMFSDAEFKVNRVQLEGGDSIVLFSDGVTETLNSDGREFGTEGLFGAINGGPINGPEDLINRCLGLVTEFRGNAQPNDDLTMLALAYV